MSERFLTIFLVSFFVGFLTSVIVSKSIKFFYSNKKIDWLYENFWVYSNENLITFVAVFIVMLLMMFFAPF